MVDDKKVENPVVKVTAAAPAAETEAPPAAPQQPLTREEQAKGVMYKYMWGNAAVGLFPIPGLDILTVGGVQLAMLKKISSIYEVEFRHNIVKPLIGSFAGALGYDLVGRGICLGLAKLLPPFGLIAGVLSFPLLAAASTYAVAKVFIQHFEAGGTLLDFEPEKMKKYFEKYYREGLDVASGRGENNNSAKSPANEKLK